jgi:hypothetical protein
MTLYQCGECSFNTDVLKFMDTHTEMSDHKWMVDFDDQEISSIVPIATLNFAEVSLIKDILKRRYPSPTPMIEGIVKKLEERISDYLAYVTLIEEGGDK